MMMGVEDHLDPLHSRLFPPKDGMENLIMEQTLTYEEKTPGTVADPPHHHDALPTFEEEHDRFEDSYRSSPVRSFRHVVKETPFVEPPSYADVVYTPYGGGGGSGEANAFGNGSSREYGNPLSLPSALSGSMFASSTFPDYLVITVSQPQKVLDNAGSSIVPGGNSYFTYLIVTQTNIPRFEGNDFSVRRRFRDVVTLADRLAESYRGYFIPARPDKGVVEGHLMQKEDFIEQRRAALEKYLYRLANHPVIRFSDELRLFLQSQSKLPLIPTTDIASRMLDGAASLPKQLFGEGSMILSPHEVAQPAKGGRDLVRLFKELKQSVTIEWGGVRPAIIEEDRAFLERKEKLLDLHQYLSVASQKAEVLIKAQQEICEITGEIGLTFTKIAKFESEEAVFNTQRTHAADAKRIATAAVKASRFYQESNAQTIKHLDQLHEYFNLMHSVNTAFNERSTALLTVQTLATEISSLNTRIEKLMVASSKVFGGDKTRNRKIEELKEALMTMEESRDSATAEYERIKEVNRTELERFDSGRQRDFMEMLKGFIHNQVGYAERIANVWSMAAEEFCPEGKIPDSIVISAVKSSA